MPVRIRPRDHAFMVLVLGRYCHGAWKTNFGKNISMNLYKLINRLVLWSTYTADRDGMVLWKMILSTMLVSAAGMVVTAFCVLPLVLAWIYENWVWSVLLIVTFPVTFAIVWYIVLRNKNLSDYINNF